MPLEAPLVSIVTVNFNQPDVTIDLINSIKTGTYPNYEIIVVDNGSKTNPEGQILASHPDVTFIRSEENLGFSGGNNLGLNVAKGSYFFLVNNDTEFTDFLIEPLIERLESDEKIGMVCPKIRFFDEPETIQFAGYTKINPFTARNSGIGCYEKDLGQHNQASITPYAHGAAMMVKRHVVEKAGVMPEMFFLYYEELDWCEMIKNAGYEIWYEPKGLIYHKESMSVGRMSALKIYFLTRNRILFVKRNMALHHKIGFLFFLLLFTIPKNTFVFILKRQWKLLKAFWSGVLWNLSKKKKLNLNW